MIVFCSLLTSHNARFYDEAFNKIRHAILGTISSVFYLNSTHSCFRWDGIRVSNESNRIEAEINIL